MKRFLLLLLAVFFSREALAVKYGCIWTESLNFYDDSLELRTGIGGNVKLITEIIPQKEYKIEDYNIEGIHKELKRLSSEAAGNSNDNFVTTSFSFIVKNKKEDYYAINVPLKHNKKVVFAFVSGFSEREGLKFKYVCASKESKAKKEENFTFQDLLLDFSKRDFSILEDNQTIIGYLDRWKEYQKTSVSESIASLEEVLKSSKDDFIEDFSSKISDRLQRKIEESRKTLGSIVDSEQLLLIYLKRNNKVLSNIFTEYEVQYESYRNHLLNEKRDYLKKIINDSFKEISENKPLTVEKFDLTKEREDFKFLEREEGLPYFLFHLHTTRELCKCCAASLASELNSELFSKFLPPNTKVSFLVSCSKKLETQDTDIRPSGIGSDQIDEEIYYHHLNKEEIFLNFSFEKNRNIVFQKLLMDDILKNEQEEYSLSTLFD